MIIVLYFVLPYRKEMSQVMLVIIVNKYKIKCRILNVCSENVMWLSVESFHLAKPRLILSQKCVKECCVSYLKSLKALLCGIMIIVVKKSVKRYFNHQKECQEIFYPMCVIIVRNTYMCIYIYVSFCAQFQLWEREFPIVSCLSCAEFGVLCLWLKESLE